MTDPLRSLADDALAIGTAAVHAVRPDRLMGGVPWTTWAPNPIDTYRSIRVVAIGKGAMPMAGAAETALGGRVSGGVAVVPRGSRASTPPDMPVPAILDVVEGDHPVPGEGSLSAGERALRTAEECAPDDLLLVLISGGGTALCARFAPGISLSDAQTTFRLLLESGADIHAMNVVRKQLSLIGGGGLVRVAGCDVLALVVSDVVGDDLAIIASGPTVPNPSTPADALAVLDRFALRTRVPKSVIAHLECRRDDAEDGVSQRSFANVRTELIGTNRMAAAAAAVTAKGLGYEARVVRTDVVGEARVVAEELVREALNTSSDKPTCLIWGGETTVSIRGNGRGGRNQELALAAGMALEGSERRCVLVSLATDGRDGPTDAAGAWVSNATMARAREAGLAPEAFLANNDSYAFFDRIGQLVRTGPTQTNVMDLQIALLDSTS
ncbi:MAG TPA: DUF4147 domain-containing protein [Rhodothermales bacterium]